jgi:hypothetical protein
MLGRHIESTTKARLSEVIQTAAAGLNGTGDEMVKMCFANLTREVDKHIEEMAEAQREFTRKQLQEQKDVHEAKIENSRKASEVTLREQQVSQAATFARQLDAKMAEFAAASGQDALMDAMKRVEELGKALEETTSKLASSEEELTNCRERLDLVDKLETELRTKDGRIGELQAELNRANAAASVSEERAVAAEMAAAAAAEDRAAMEEAVATKAFGLSAALGVATIFRTKRKNAQLRLAAVENSLELMTEQRDALREELTVRLPAPGNSRPLLVWWHGGRLLLRYTQRTSTAHACPPRTPTVRLDCPLTPLSLSLLADVDCGPRLSHSPSLSPSSAGGQEGRVPASQGAGGGGGRPCRLRGAASELCGGTCGLGGGGGGVAAAHRRARGGTGGVDGEM